MGVGDVGAGTTSLPQGMLDASVHSAALWRGSRRVFFRLECAQKSPGDLTSHVDSGSGDLSGIGPRCWIFNQPLGVWYCLSVDPV